MSTPRNPGQTADQVAGQIPALTRSEAELLLPFHANGSLGEAEERAIEAWIARDAELAAEAGWLREIRAELRDEACESPGAAGLDRLLAALDTPDGVQQPALQSDQLASVAPHMADSRPDTRHVSTPAPAANLASRPWVWQCAAALAAAAFLGQSYNLWRSETAMPQPGGYELASAVAVSAADAGPQITVGFAPEAEESAIRALLVGLGLEISSGPSALGFYRLAGAQAERLDPLLAALRASPIVETVEHDPD